MSKATFRQDIPGSKQGMKIAYDPEVDTLSITFRETTVTTKHLVEGIAADYDTACTGKRLTVDTRSEEGWSNFDINPPPAVL